MNLQKLSLIGWAAFLRIAALRPKPPTSIATT